MSNNSRPNQHENTSLLSKYQGVSPTAKKEKLHTDHDIYDPFTRGQKGVRLTKREKWTKAIDFFIACVGLGVGLGNVWRFPYLCYKNGGGAFLIPYFTCVVLIGIPLFFLEASLGQLTGQGCINAWMICPLFKGVGLAIIVIVGVISIYYNIIIAWTLHYLFASFTSELPWSHCNNYWNTPACKVGNTPNASIIDFATNTTININKTEGAIIGTDPVTEYWERRVLKISSGIEDLGSINWDLALCLLLGWIIIYFCIWKGIKVSGKVMYVTAPAPYVLMIILLVRGVTLDGAAEGIKFYLIPDWNKLATQEIWVDAAIQTMFSYAVCFGTVIGLGSFNKFRHNCWRDSLIFAVVNSGTSFLAGFVIFSVLGFMAKENGVSVADVAESGPGLAFIVYPKAVAAMPLAPLWSILFFLMLLFLGIDSLFVGVECFATAIIDVFPTHLRGRPNREIFIAGICIFNFLLGLTMVTEGGIYVFLVLDHYGGSRIIPLIAALECIIVAWCYGANRYYDDLELMVGKRIGPWMKICWMVLTPLTTLAVFVMSAVRYTEVSYNRSYTYPSWVIGLGWMIASISVLMLPLVMLLQILYTKGTFTQRIRTLMEARIQDRSRDVDESTNSKN